MSNTSAKPWSYRVFLLTSGHFLSDFYSNFLPALLPFVLSTLGLSLTSGGLLVMIHAFMSSVLQPIFGYYVDKSGYTWLMLLTLPASAIFISVAGLADNYAVLFLFVSLSGLGSSLFHPLASSLVSKVTMPQNKGIAMAVFIGGGNFGYALAPAAVIFILVNYGASLLPWLIIPGLLLTALFYINGLHSIPASGNTRFTNTQAPAWYKSASLLKLNFVMGLKSWSQVALPTFLPVWMAQQGHAPTVAGSMLTVYLAAGAVGSLFGGYIGDRLGRKKAIIGSLAVCLPAMYYLIATDQLTPLTWIALAVSGGALQGTIPSSVVWAQDMLPENAAMASGMMMGLSFGLGGLGTALTGAAADTIGLKAAMLWTLLPLAAAIPLACWIPENRQIPQTSAAVLDQKD
jgi:FSR family fosmidomycin resistance protein-like MFS transporter